MQLGYEISKYDIDLVLNAYKKHFESYSHFDDQNLMDILKESKIKVKTI